MIVKIPLSALFVYGIRVTDLIYIELSSIIAQSSMLVISLYLLLNKKNIFQISYKYFSLKWENVKTILLMSLPLFLGKFVISLGKVIVNAICKVYGSLTVGALGVSNNICGLITNCGASFEDSESSIVSQNLGNKNMKRTMKVFIVSIILMAIWTVFGYLCVRVFFQDQIINLFSTKNTSPDFIKSIKDIFFYDSLSIPALAINSVILGLLYGYGQTFLATIVNILRIVTRISTLFILQTYFPQIGIYLFIIVKIVRCNFLPLFPISFVAFCHKRRVLFPMIVNNKSGKEHNHADSTCCQKRNLTDRSRNCHPYSSYVCRFSEPSSPAAGDGSLQLQGNPQRDSGRCRCRR